MQDQIIAEGSPVPKFEMSDADGNKISSADFEGKRHVIYFYPRDFTPGCTTEAGEFANEYEEFQKEGIEIIGVSPDDVDSHKKFCKKMNIKYRVLADSDKSVAKKFGVWGKKKFMGREYMGVIRSTFLVGEDGKIFRVFPKVKPAGHARKVLAEFQRE